MGLQTNEKSNSFIAYNDSYPATFEFTDDLLNRLYLSIQ